MEFNRRQQLKADFFLALVTLVWGATFVAVKNAVADISPFTFIAIRFTVSCLFLALIYPRKLLLINQHNLLAGVLIGTCLFGGYTLQTVGLKYTSASNAGFITGLSVVLVPLFITIATRQSPGVFTTLGILSAACGLGLLTLGPAFALNKGDILVFFCAVCFALHIIAVGKFAPDMDAALLAILQIGTVAILAWLTSLAWHAPAPVFTRDVWIGLLVTAIPATSLAFLIQTAMQKFTTSTRTAIIFTMEPVFSAVFAYLLAGERLGLRGILGAALVLAGMTLSEVNPCRDSDAA